MIKRCVCVLSALLLLSSKTEALDACFCARDNPAVQKCGEVLRFDPTDSVSLRECVLINGKRQKVPAVNLSFLNYTECSPPPDADPCEGKVPPPGESFSIMGSNTIGEVLMPALIKGFAAQRGYAVDGDRCNADLRLRGRDIGANAMTIRCEARGTHTGIPALADKNADIAMLSRPISEQEQALMRRLGFGKMTYIPFESVIGLDGLRLIVSPQNPVDALSLDAIARIFSGEIDNWSAVGGRPGRINLYARDTNSGTRDTFEHLVMEPSGKRIAASAESFESSGALADAVRDDANGIGFVGFAYSEGTKALAISEPCGIQHEPSIVSIKTEDYPLSRRLFLYKAKPKSAFAEDLVTYALSDAAQPVIEGAGFVNQTIESLDKAETRSRIIDYAAAPTREPGLDVPSDYVSKLLGDINGARRLSISFRFRFGRSDLDTKALDDAIRLARFLTDQNSRNGRVLLVGFADAVGSFEANLALAEKRANSVREALIKTGANLDRAAITIKGYSELLPVACNTSDLGREKNRRVEVYLLDR